MLDLLIRKRLGVLLLFCLLAASGIYLVGHLSVQLYPRVNRPRLMANIRHSGYSAVAFHEQYSSDIESRLLAVEGLELLEARYGSNQSSFTLTFDWTSDADKVKADTEAVLNTINSNFPEELQSPVQVRFFSGENAGYLMLGLSSASVSPEDLYKLVKSNAEPRLLQIQDMDLLEVFNVEDLKASIVLRQLDMLHHGVTIADVNAALQADSGSQSIGTLTEGQQRLSVSFDKKDPALFDLENLAVKQVNGTDVLLGSVADIDIFYTIPSATFVLDGARGIQITCNPVDGGIISVMSR